MQTADDTSNESTQSTDPNQNKQGKIAESAPSHQEAQEASKAGGSNDSEYPAPGLEVNDSQNTAGGWKYSGEESLPQSSLQPVSWSASEFIEHEKQISWFAAVAVIAIAVALIIYLLTRDIVNAVMIIVVAGLFAGFGARKPRTLSYELNAQGVRIANRTYNYSNFKSFAIIQEGAINSIQLSPLKRFAIPISLYFPPEQEETIVNMVANYLPNDLRKSDPIDRLMHKVRF